MPISAILFGGRRATNVPLVTEAFDWQHGVFLGSIMSSEKTAAAAGTVGEVRFDPFAMLPFWATTSATTSQPLARDRRAPPTLDKLPKLFWVNWFRKGDDGKFLWPGFGENSRVLKWVVERVDGTADAVDTAIGRVPTRRGARHHRPRPRRRPRSTQLLDVDNEAWRGEIPLIEDHFEFIGERLPAELPDELRELEKRLAGS